MEIDKSLSIPVSTEQVVAFKEWVIKRYGEYAVYRARTARLMPDAEIDEYIGSHILTQEMVDVLNESETFVDVKTTPVLHIRNLLLCRKRVLDKIKYMKWELGEKAFAEEIAERRRQEEELYNSMKELHNSLYCYV